MTDQAVRAVVGMEERVKKVYLERLDRYQSTLFYPHDNLWSKIQGKCHSVFLEVYSSPEELTWEQVHQRPFAPCQVGHLFGPSWSTHWFRVQHSFEGSAVLWWDSESEAMFYTAQGHPVASVNDGDRHWVETALLGTLFYVEMVGVGMGGNATGPIMIAPPQPDRQFRLKRAEVVELNCEALNLWRDLRILIELYKHNGDERALLTGNEICNATLRPDLENQLSGGTEIAANYFAKHGASTNLSTVTAVGNCHIDTAWLWPWSETRRKTARSWVSQLRLMEKYPEYRFVASQMQQLEWLRQDYPSLFKEIQQAAQRGQFIPIGGSWVEMDGNIPGGESFVRQLLYGQRFQQEHFNQRSRIFWLPGKIGLLMLDTFGYHGQLPQIIKQAGMDFFMTTKMAWSNFNRFPHTSFRWQGIDGTQVLAHLPPANTYTSTNIVQDAVKCGKSTSKHSLLLYGHGDGGGGPTEEMLYTLRRVEGLQGMPPIKQRHPEAFFADLDGEHLPLWQGEMYLEAHQGTLTSQARTKYYNRKCEGLLLEAELACTIASLAIGPGEYPADSLEQLWKGILLCQFHDILPGSSIEKVYEDSDRIYVNVEYWASRIREVAMQHLFGVPGAKAEVDLQAHRTPMVPDSMRALKKDLAIIADSPVAITALDSIVFLNPTPFARGEVIVLPFSEDDPRSPQRGVIAVEGIPAWSMATFEHHAVEQVSDRAVVQGDAVHGYFMENGLIRAEFDLTGQLVRLYDKKVDREVCLAGQVGNQLVMYEDMPRYWDAWDVEWYAREKGWPMLDATVEIGRTGPLLVTLIRRVKLDAHGSELTQVISLTYLSSLLEFYTNVEWKAKHRMLRVNFPLAIHATTAKFECPFGIQERSVLKNTLWQQAQFEVCAHRWVSISEGMGYSGALLNDCKYGHSVEPIGRNGTVLSMTLLRSPRMPDPSCDEGEHVFRYALWTGATADPMAWIAEAHHFNTPLRWTAASPGRYDPAWLHHSFLQFTPACSLIMSGIKRAEHREANWYVLRAYECAGGRGKTRLECHPRLVIKDCLRVNLLEDPLGHGVEIEYGPYEIISLLVHLEMKP